MNQTTPAQPEGELLVQAHRVLNEYAERDSCIDNGNLYFAACAFRDALAATKAKLERAEGALREIRTNIVVYAPDTVWFSKYETMVDYLDGVIEELDPSPPQADSGEAKGKQ